MKFLLMVAAILFVCTAAAKDLLPTIEINEEVKTALGLPPHLLQPIDQLNGVIKDFNSKVDMEKLEPLLKSSGEAGLAVLDSLQKFVLLSAQGFANPFAIGDTAKAASQAASKVLNALEEARKVPIEIPGDEAITTVIKEMIPILEIVKCANPFNCLFGKK